jgi:singapore isolate B (sub-type 7) whole genome shotgun sequence assembly, scaffold_1
VIPRILGVIGSGIDDDDILQKCLEILIFLTELKQVQNNDALLIENVSTLLCVASSEKIQWNRRTLMWRIF